MKNEELVWFFMFARKSVQIFIETIFVFLFLTFLKSYLTLFVPIKYIPNFVQTFGVLFFVDYMCILVQRAFSFLKRSE
jgi:hypothetical protein